MASQAITPADVLKVAHFPFAWPEINVGPYYTYKLPSAGATVPFIRVRTDRDNPILLQTPAFTLRNGPLKPAAGGIVFGIDEALCPRLATCISSLEHVISLKLRETDINDLPEEYSSIKLSETPLRPLTGKGERFFIKSAQDCSIYDWDGQVYNGALEAGRYQLMLRISSIYLGQHGKSNYRASIQVRVAQIRYSPGETNTVLPFLFYEDPAEIINIFDFTNVSTQDLFPAGLELEPMESATEPVPLKKKKKKVTTDLETVAPKKKK